MSFTFWKKFAFHNWQFGMLLPGCFGTQSHIILIQGSQKITIILEVWVHHPWKGIWLGNLQKRLMPTKCQRKEPVRGALCASQSPLAPSPFVLSLQNLFHQKIWPCSHFSPLLPASPHFSPLLPTSLDVPSTIGTVSLAEAAEWEGLQQSTESETQHEASSSFFNIS